MSRPTDAGSFAEAVYAQLTPLTYGDSDATGWPLLLYIGALGQMLQELDYLAHNGVAGTPWENILDLDMIPDHGLPWLGQMAGVRVDTGQSAALQRQQIRNHSGWGRGSVATFLASAKYLLTGTQTVVVTERTNDAYTFLVNTYSTETPNSAAVLAVLTANKPAGLVMTYNVLAGSPAGTFYSTLYGEPTSFAYSNIYSNFQTYADIH